MSNYSHAISIGERIAYMREQPRSDMYSHCVIDDYNYEDIHILEAINHAYTDLSQDAEKDHENWATIELMAGLMCLTMTERRLAFEIADLT